MIPDEFIPVNEPLLDGNEERDCNIRGIADVTLVMKLIPQLVPRFSVVGSAEARNSRAGIVGNAIAAAQLRPERAIGV